MNSFAVLADDVEDADDLTPVTKAVPEVVAEVTQEARKPSAQQVSKAESRDLRSAFQEDRSRGGYRGGRGRGGRGGRGTRGARGRGGRGGRGRGGTYGRESRGADANGWERRPGGGEDKPHGDRGRPARFEANGKHEEDKTDKVEEKPSIVDEGNTKEDGAGGEDEKEKEPEAKVVAVEEKSMGLDEYLEQKKAAAVVALRSGNAPTRKMNEVGGKMTAFKRTESTDETSIFSAVSMKSAAEPGVEKQRPESNSGKVDATQEFFRSQPRRGRGRGRGGYHDYRNGNNQRQRFDRRSANAPNVDDTNAFPSLSS